MIEGSWEKIQANITKLAKDPDGLPQIVKLQNQYYDALVKAGAPLSQIDAAQVSILTTQLKYVQSWSDSSDAITQATIKLDNARVQQNAFNDSINATGVLYTNIQKEFGAAFTEFGTGIGNAIAGTESFHQAFSTALTDMEKKLSELVTNFLLGELKNAFIQNTDAVNAFGKAFSAVFGIAGPSTSGASAASGGVKVVTGANSSDGSSDDPGAAGGSSTRHRRTRFASIHGEPAGCDRKLSRGAHSGH